MVVLFIVAAISVLSFGYVVKADRELSCADNTDFRMEMDYLGQTALNHAKALIINPQNVTTGSGGYWQGKDELKIKPGKDFYDITVAQSTGGLTPRCTYDVTINAYRKDGGLRISETKLQSQLRFDPCIAYWSNASSSIPSNMLIYGDVYCNGTFICSSTLEGADTVVGDVYSDTFAGWKTGQHYSKADITVEWPAIDADDYSGGDYYIDGVRYQCKILYSDNYSNIEMTTDESSNPARLFYRPGNLKLQGNVKINGSLIINGDLLVEVGQASITATKNFPAILADEKLIIINDGKLTVSGLVHVEEMEVGDSASDISITGGLFIEEKAIDIKDDYSGTVTVTADPMLSSLKLEESDGDVLKWMPAGGAYYKSTKRYE